MTKEDAELLLKHKDEKVKELAKAYLHVLESPYYDTYITISDQLKNWNEQLRLGEIVEKEIAGVKCKVQDGKIDLFADKDTKDFDRAFKYFSDSLLLCETLEKMKAKLTPDEVQKIADKNIGSSYEKAMEKAKKG
jgi:hypothetical protein